MPRGVKKVVEPVEEAKVEEAVADEVAAEAPAEEVPAAEEVKVEEAAVEEAVAEEPKTEEVAETAEEVEEEAKEEEVAAVAEEVAAEKVIVEEAKPEVKSEWTFVSNLRAYPNLADPSRIAFITGNVKVVGEVKGYKKIQYMKHGFGVVTAYTKAL